MVRSASKFVPQHVATPYACAKEARCFPLVEFRETLVDFRRAELTFDIPVYRSSVEIVFRRARISAVRSRPEIQITKFSNMNNILHLLQLS